MPATLSYHTTLTSKRQVTLRKLATDALKLKPGSRVKVTYSKNAITIAKASGLEAIAGMFAHKVRNKRVLTPQEIDDVVSDAIIDDYQSELLAE